MTARTSHPALILTAAAPHPDLGQIWIGHVTMMMVVSPPGVTPCHQGTWGDHWGWWVVVGFRFRMEVVVSLVLSYQKGLDESMQVGIWSRS